MSPIINSCARNGECFFLFYYLAERGTLSHRLFFFQPREIVTIIAAGGCAMRRERVRIIGTILENFADFFIA